MAKRLTAAQTRKLLSRPTRDLDAAELDTRREIIAAGRVKTTPGRKKKKGAKGLDVGGVASLLKKRRKRREAIFE